jgi:hypothetical protein
MMENIGVWGYDERGRDSHTTAEELAATPTALRATNRTRNRRWGGGGSLNARTKCNRGRLKTCSSCSELRSSAEKTVRMKLRRRSSTASLFGASNASYGADGQTALRSLGKSDACQLKRIKHGVHGVPAATHTSPKQPPPPPKQQQQKLCFKRRTVSQIARGCGSKWASASELGLFDTRTCRAVTEPQHAGVKGGMYNATGWGLYLLPSIRHKQATNPAAQPKLPSAQKTPYSSHSSAFVAEDRRRHCQ